MGEEIEYRRQIVKKYEQEIMPLLKYIPWLEQKAGARVSATYNGEELGSHSMTFPVYDGTLMNFVREVQKTDLMDRNYPYIYSRNGIRNLEDEKRMIDRATISEFPILSGILSKYIMGGATKSYLWPQGVETGVFLKVLTKMKSLLEFWDKPLA